MRDKCAQNLYKAIKPYDIPKLWDLIKKSNQKDDSLDELAAALDGQEFVPDNNGETCKICLITDSRVVVGDLCDYCLEEGHTRKASEYEDEAYWESVSDQRSTANWWNGK